MSPLRGEMPIQSLPGFQDPVSAATHLLAVPVFLLVGVFLLRRGRGDWARLFYLGIFVFASAFLLAMSGMYHLLTLPSTERSVMERLDHAAIFVLIAATFTPVYGILYRGAWRWVPLVLIWTCAVTAIILKTIYFSRVPEVLGLCIFLGLGWLGVLSAFALWRRFGWAFVRPLVWGGATYTVGAVLEFWCVPMVVHGIIGPHEFYHLLILAAMTCHWRFVFQFAEGLENVRQCSFRVDQVRVDDVALTSNSL